MDTKLIIFIIAAVIYLLFVPYVRMWDDDTKAGWKTFFFKVMPLRTVILLIIYLIIF